MPPLKFILQSPQAGRIRYWNGTGWSDRITRTYTQSEARQTLDNMEARGVYGATMQPYRKR